MKRIALLNVKYSPNLGDGVIAECLEAELMGLHPDWQVFSVDLAGRESYGTGLDAKRGQVLRVLDAMPALIRQIATIAALLTLIQLKYRKVWRRQLGGARGAIVGGGQLFADTDLNFPLKTYFILREARRVNAQIAVFGVGVAETLSTSARRLFLLGLKRFALRHVAVRDSASRYNWNRHFGRAGVANASLCCDPGLLAADVYPAGTARMARTGREVGIGIINPRTLDLHSGDDDDFSIKAAKDFWTGLARELLARGFGVTLFTNGPQDDEIFLDSVASRIDDGRVKRASRPLAPQQLADTIRSFDAIISHRLHANILAYAFRIPHVGLSWDPKVEAFFGSVGRRDYVANYTQTDPDSVASLIEDAMAKGIDAGSHAEVIEKTRSAIRICAAELAASIEAEPASCSGRAAPIAG